MKIIISLLIGILIISIASYMPMSYSFPIIATFIDDPKRCDTIPTTQLTEELGENPTAPIPFPKDEEIGGSLGVPIRAVCVANDGDNANDFDVAITNNSPNFFTNLFFVADTGISIGNADGTIGGDDAFRIDNLGVNKNLVAESMRPDGIFEPGETWNFIVTNFGAANAGESPAFFSRGIGPASAAIQRSSSSIVAQPSVDFIIETNVSPINAETQCREGFALVYRLNADKYACVFETTVEKWENLGIAKQVEQVIHEPKTPEIIESSNVIESSDECFSDSDCPAETPICLLQKYAIDDMSFAKYVCMSKEEGNKIKDEKYQSCLESKEKSYQDALEKDGKIFDIGDLKKSHKANLNGAFVQFLPYLVNNLNLDVKQVMKEEYQLDIIRMGGSDNVVIVSMPTKNEVETFCTLELDNRIMTARSNIDWTPIE